jgi:hypothetical protein
MVKLIRLKGDSTKNNKEIRNIFSDSISLSKNSRIALRSCKVDFLSSIDQEQYDLTADGEYKYYLGGDSGFKQTVTVPSGVYSSANALLRAMQISANSSLTHPTLFSGVHNIWKVEQDRAILEVYRAQLSDAQFATDWIQLDGQDLTLGLSTITSSGDGDNRVILPQIIPLVNASFNATINPAIPSAGGFSISAVKFDDAGTAMWGMTYDTASNHYSMIVNGLPTIDTGVARLSGDEITISKEGDKFSFLVQRSVASGGNVVVNQEQTLPASVLALQSLFWAIDMDENSGTQFSLSNCDCFALSKLTPTLTSLSSEVPVDVHVNFGKGNELSHYLGFPDSTYENQGQPAVIRGERNIKGKLTYSGIMINILGLDLDSYTGASGTQPNNLNILDVLYPDNSSSAIQYIVNDPLKLDVKNSNPIVVRDLTLAFVRDDTGSQLEFIGTPVVVLEVYDEDES